MTIAAGRRHTIPKGTMVWDHVLKTKALRCVSYPVHVDHVKAGRVYWFGDCARLMSCAEDDVDLSSPAPCRGGPTGSQYRRGW